MFNQNTHSLVLRACREDMSSKNDFKWPSSGIVECPDWDSAPKCGNGLHGWLYGHGDGSVNRYWSDNDKWLVVSVENSYIIELDGKVKFKKGEVLFCGDRKSATEFLLEHEPRSLQQPVIGAFITVGDNQTAITGFKGTSTSEFKGTSTSGFKGTSASGENGTSISGEKGTSTSSDYGTSTSGNFGTSTSGNFGTSTSGNFGTSTSGKNGISISGFNGKCKAGVNGIIQIKYVDIKTNKFKIKTGYIGEDRLKPNTFYKLDKKLNFVKCK